MTFKKSKKFNFFSPYFLYIIFWFFLTLIFYLFLEKANLIFEFNSYFLKLFISLNLACFLLFGVDKFFSIIKIFKRAPEKILLLSILFGGALGGLLGMYVFRHKIKRSKFHILALVFLLAQVIIVFVIKS